MPLVSIITPSYNSARFLTRTIRSVQQQDYPRIEHIIIDGGSSDETLDILRSYSHLIWISERDQGQSNALNKGFRIAGGEIIGWLNADDTYNPQAVWEAVAYLKQHLEAIAVFGRCNVIDERDRVQYVLDAPPFSLAQDLLEHRVPQPATFMRRTALEQVGYLDEDLHYVMDRDLFLKLGYRGRLDSIGAIWANFRECEGTKTASHPERFWMETLQVFDRFFVLPNLPAEVLAVKRRAYARAHWMAGILHYTRLGDPVAQAAGRDTCRTALDWHPLLTDDLDFVADQLVHWAVSRVGSEQAETYVGRVLSESAAPDAVRFRALRYVLGHLYASMALMAQPSSPLPVAQSRMRLRWIWNAVSRDPTWLRNGGILAAILRDVPASIGLPRRQGGAE
ncbi:MAG: glycosyltransferase [Caldilineaceae bacterium]|nr:glycosyltransferase [Caldilineaceae bacterium]